MNPLPPPGEFLHCAAAARLLALSTRQIYRLIYQGDLEAVRLGRRSLRIRRRSLERLIESRRVEPTPADELQDLRSHNPAWRERREGRRPASSPQSRKDSPDGNPRPSE